MQLQKNPSRVLSKYQSQKETISEINVKYFRNYVVFIISIVITFMAGSHLLDVGDIAGDLALTNGFFSIKASKIYHVGFYLLYFSFILMVLSNLWIYSKYISKER